jgi:hypothetical protein
MLMKSFSDDKFNDEEENQYRHTLPFAHITRPISSTERASPVIDGIIKNRLRIWFTR